LIVHSRNLGGAYNTITFLEKEPWTEMELFSKSFTPLSWSGSSAYLASSWNAYSKTIGHDIITIYITSRTA